MVEFEPDSIWYETSLTITAQAINEGIRVGYHTFRHIPNEVRHALSRLGLNAKNLEEKGRLEIIDSYTVQTGLGVPESDYPVSRSLKLSDWSIAFAQLIKTGFSEEDKGWLHIDDDTSVLNKYNSENSIIEFWRTRGIPQSRASESVSLNSLLKGAASESFYKQFEALCDGIVDLKSEEREGIIENSLRVRTIRGKKYDSKWHKLELGDNGEVAVAE